MRTTATLICLLIVTASIAEARRVAQEEPRFHSPPVAEPLPADLMQFMPLRTAAPPDTTYLGWWDFEGGGMGDPQGWVGIDFTAQDEGPMWQVTDAAGINGLWSIFISEGLQSLYCGATNYDENDPPFCGYATIPTYGNNWNQRLLSDTLACDSVRVYYKIQWDSEPGYDRTVVEFNEGFGWFGLTVNGGIGYYDGSGSLDECLAFGTPGGQAVLRFKFTSDGAWSGEDGLYPTQGTLLDSITVQCFNNGVLTGTYYEDFESAAIGDRSAGIWTATLPEPFGDFSDLYSGLTVLQNADDCVFNSSFVWGFFDDPANHYVSCFGQVDPTQGAVPDGPSVEGLYLDNFVVSPKIPISTTSAKTLVSYDTYLDNPLEALKFETWFVRSWVDGCPGQWRSSNFRFFFGVHGWVTRTVNVAPYIDDGATEIEVALGVQDACGFWCGVFGLGICEVQPPLYDNVRVMQVDNIGPEFSVRHIDLFQDTFAADGTTTGTARADAANDIAPGASPAILPGDSISATLTGIGEDPISGAGPAAYVYVAVWPPNQTGKSPADLEAPETRGGVGKRFPLVNTMVHDGVTWACFRMDSAFSTGGVLSEDRYCFDLNDAVFNPCDTVCYVLAADDGMGTTNYWSRRLNGQGEDFVTDSMAEALGSPLEFTVLPAGGWKRGGDILYVDNADDRAGPPQLYFDWAFKGLQADEHIDRYDVLGPSSVVNNSLASRVKNIGVQIIACYKVIIWSSGSLSVGTVGDGTGSPSKVNDYELLYTFLDTHPNYPGLFLTGDDLAQEWVSLSGVNAVSLQSDYMNFNLVNGDHVNAGEPLSPQLTATGACFLVPSPHQFFVYGGCPAIRDFDVLQASGLSFTEFPYPNGSGDAVISQVTPNQNGSTARTMLSGFSFNSIRDVGQPVVVPARVRYIQQIFSWMQNSYGPPTGLPTSGSRDFLAHAAPNPFNPQTTIRYGVRERGHITLRIYNVAGQLVRTLVDDIKSPRAEGFEVTWDGRGDRGNAAATGVYFYKLVAPGFTQTKKMVLLK